MDEIALPEVPHRRRRFFDRIGRSRRWPAILLFTTAIFVLAGAAVVTVVTKQVRRPIRREEIVAAQTFVRRQFPPSAVLHFAGEEETTVERVSDVEYTVRAWVDVVEGGAGMRNVFVCTVRKQSEGMWVLRRVNVIPAM
ncbi:MAG TPA: hypothetical protein VG675_17225 [Bryobacteraceae bacterium]|nr:hypothetical protein [Bryobacteraceae bacterium]